MLPVISLVRRLFSGNRPPARRRRPTRTIIAAPPPREGQAASSGPPKDSPQVYLARVTEKINRLAEEFAEGKINRAQFQELFEHYQRERQGLQSWINSQTPTEDWRTAVNEGHSMVIRTLHTARVLGYAVYANDSGVPLNTIGQFDLDPALAVPMLSAYRSAAREIFGGEVRSTQIEGGEWLTFIPGQYTTMLAVFSTEPASRQIQTLEDLHSVFERANRVHLARPHIDPGRLVFPHGSLLGRLE